MACCSVEANVDYSVVSRYLRLGGVITARDVVNDSCMSNEDSLNQKDKISIFKRKNKHKMHSFSLIIA